MRRIRGRRRAELAVLLALAAGPGAVALPDPLPLAPGLALEQPLAAGETRSSMPSSPPARLYLLAVEQRGIHLAVDVRGPDGATSPRSTPPWTAGGSRPSSSARPPRAAYRIEVRAAAKGVGPGRCAIRLEKLRESTPAEPGTDRRPGRDDAGGHDPAPRAHGQPRQGPGGPPGGARPLPGRRRPAGRGRGGRRPRRRHPPSGQAEPGRRALPRGGLALAGAGPARARDAGLERPRAHPLGDERAARRRRGPRPRPRPRAPPRSRLPRPTCATTSAWSSTPGAASEPALACYREALALYHRLGETKDEATALNNLGFASFSLGEPGPAEESYRQALAIRRAIGDRGGEAQALNNLAVLYRGLGEIDEALKAYGEAREILATLDDRRQEAATLNNLGVAYSAIGEAERARLYLTQALALRRAVEDRRGEIVTLNNLGWLERKSGAAGKAVLLHRQALAVARATADARNEGISRSYLGEALAAAGRSAEALAELDRALALQRQTGDRFNEAITLRRKGEVLAAGGQAAEALPLFEQALLASRAAGRPRQRGHDPRRAGPRPADPGGRGSRQGGERRRSRHRGPRIAPRAAGQPRAARRLPRLPRRRLRAARRHPDAPRRRPPGQGFDRAAFEASEDARARSLLDVLRESGAEIRSGVDPALAARQRDLERRLALKADRRQILLGRGKGEAGREQGPGDRKRADPGRARQPRRRDPAEQPALRRSHPSRGREHGGDPGAPRLRDAPPRVLPRPRAGYLWAVDAARLRSFVLPGREEIERAARAFHQALSTPGGRTAAATGYSSGRRSAGCSSARWPNAISESAAWRSSPTAPWATSPSTSCPSPGTAEPLLVRHEVVELPSASVLAAERRELARRPPARELAIVLADPVFQADDPRVARRAEAEGSPAGAVRSPLLQPSPLLPPGSAGDRFPGAAGRGHHPARLRGRPRPRPLRRPARLPLHPLRHPRRFRRGAAGALGPRPLRRRCGRPAPRRFPPPARHLRASTSAADLVVLSGCQTALGKEIRGEGLLGLTRGFLYAGAPRVVASLWWIDDRATAALMAEFYRGLWSEGLRPAAALRKARLSLRASTVSAIPPTGEPSFSRGTGSDSVQIHEKENDQPWPSSDTRTGTGRSVNPSSTDGCIRTRRSRSVARSRG